MEAQRDQDFTAGRAGMCVKVLVLGMKPPPNPKSVHKKQGAVVLGVYRAW